MTDQIAPDVAETSPSPEDAESSQVDSSPKQTVAEPESPPEIEEPKRNRAEERITGLVSDVKSLREYGEYMRQEVLSLRNQITPPQTPQPVKSEPQPTLEQFEFDQDKFAVANNKWVTDQAAQIAKATVDAALKQQAGVNEQAGIRDTWQNKSAEFAEKHADFDDVVKNPTIRITEDMANIFMESDKGPDIAYHLGKNPDVAARISRLPLQKMALAIGRLEAEVSKPSPKPQQTNAPEPPNPVGGTQPTIDAASLSTADWINQRNEERRAKGLR